MRSPAPRDGASDLLLRPATPSDADGLADLFVGARRDAYPEMPPSVHSRAQVRERLARLLGGEHDAWVAERDADVVGYLVLEGDWLESLYVRSDALRTGVGSALLQLAKGLRPGGFGLWVFLSNARARRFYRRHGLVELRHTDGTENEEGVPDVEMAWPGGSVRAGEYVRHPDR